MAIRNSIRLAMPVAATALWLGLGSVAAQADTLYNDIPYSDPNLAHEHTSFASFANSVSSFGSLIHPDSLGNIGSANVVLSNYATLAQYAGSGLGYTVDLTLSLYNVGGQTNVPAAAPDQTFSLGSLIASASATSFIQWRPSGNTAQTCGGNNENAYSDGSGQSCGQLNFAHFQFSGPPAPQATGDFIWLVSIGRSDFNAANSLNWAISDGTYNLAPGDTGSYTATSNPQYGTNYLNGAGTNGFGSIANWADVGQGEIQFAPEPATFGLIGLGLVGLGIAARRKKRSL